MALETSASPFLERLSLLDGRAPAMDEGAHHVRYEELLTRAAHMARVLGGDEGLHGAKVAILASPSAAWVEAFLGVLMAGGVAVPLSPAYPPAELAWFGDDARASTVILSPDLAAHGADLAKGRRVVAVDAGRGGPSAAPSIAIAPSDPALYLYTSGTTGKPKGAVISHANVDAQTSLLREAWAMSPRDTLLHALPLHHLHGLGISLLTALSSGARARMLPRFDAERVWEGLADATVWMAVPTMYHKLLAAFDAADPDTRDRWAKGARGLRLATSGSAALPVTLASRWSAIAGAIPLERFGKTEIGVGMSNPLDPSARRPGSVGLPLPTVEARIVDDEGRDHDTGPGELLIRGPSVFAEYFGREEATKSAFTSDGWFKTGDVAERSADGYVRLLGRTSVDILKSGGYKLSALEVEEALRESPAVAEVAVVGVADEAWGERVVAAIVPVPGRAGECATESIRAAMRDRLASYKLPREVIVLDALPRNAMGKVMKPELVKQITAARGG